jgi:hypothetical protein
MRVSYPELGLTKALIAGEDIDCKHALTRALATANTLPMLGQTYFSGPCAGSSTHEGAPVCRGLLTGWAVPAAVH